MGDKTDKTGGLHYHYHYYGDQGGPTPEAAQPPQMPGRPQMPGQPGFPGRPAPGAGNPHPHPQADSLVKGLAVGAGAAWLLTSESTQRVIMRGAVQLWTALQGGIEELKERYHDAEAEAAAEASVSPQAPADPALAGDEPPARPRPVRKG